MNETAFRAARPWEQPIWKPAPGQTGTLAFILMIHAVAAVGLILFPLPRIEILVASLLIAGIGGLGTTVCYHRALAHKTLKLNPVLEHLLIFCAMFNGSGAPLSWVAYHRHHHSRADTEDDISSPKHGGFWWAHLRWLYQSPVADYQRWSPEMLRGSYNIWNTLQPAIIVASMLCGLPFGWQAFFWIGAIRLVYSLHIQCLVNSFTHLNETDEGDSSMNVWWLGPFQLGAWGENWHRNHHAAAGSARLGWHWWQVDVGWYFICAMEAVGLASNVKRIRKR